MPWYVTAFLKLVGPFIDPVTKTKIRYNEPLPDHIPAEQLMKNAGGECEFEYDHATYWPALDALATKRRKEMTERWEKAGKHIGESEVYIRGGDEPSVGSKAETTGVDEVANGVEKLAVNGTEAKPAETKAETAPAEVKPAETKPVEAKDPEKVPEKMENGPLAPKNEGVDEIKPVA